MIAGVVGLHIWALHHVGQNNPTGVEVKDVKKDTVPFTPYATHQGRFAWSASCSSSRGSCSISRTSSAMPTTTSRPTRRDAAHIVPEWYFLPFYAILRAIPDKLGGVIAMGGAIVILAFLPWLDTSKVKSMTYRPIASQFFWAFVLVCIGLGYLGAMPAEGPTSPSRAS
jgi:ubiquinol-cytochrome c reductase cytochrome b/c1 subunit